MPRTHSSNVISPMLLSRVIHVFTAKRPHRLGQAHGQRIALLAVRGIRDLGRDPAIEHVAGLFGTAFAISVTPSECLFGTGIFAETGPFDVTLLVEEHAAAEATVGRRLRLVPAVG